MMLKKLLAVILTVTMVLGTVMIPAYANQDVKPHGYDNLNDEAGNLVIGFLGGSITVADGDSNSMNFNRYATRVTEWFQETYPAKNVTQVNAGIGGTGSDLGKYRVMTDIGAHAPDVVFVEYAVNDANYSRLYSESTRSNMETIVRNLQSLPKVPVIVFLYSMHDDSYAKLNYTSIPDHQAVADYYGIEAIDFYSYMKPLVAKGEFVWDKNAEGTLTHDNIHPNAAGHEQYGEYIISQLESQDILHKNNEGLAPKFDFTTKNTRDIKLSEAQKSGSWTDAYAGQSDNKYEAIQSTATGDFITYTYQSSGNDTIGVTILRGEGSWVIDEGTENEITGEISVSDSNLPVVKTFATNLSAGEHTVKIVNTADGTDVPHLKLGRLIANDGRETVPATTAANGDHVPATMPANLIKGSQTANFVVGNNGKASYSKYEQDYTGNSTVYKFEAIDAVSKTYWGGEGVNIKRLTESDGPETTGILYPEYTATQGTYVLKARVRALAGTPRIGSATSLSYVPTYDNIYKSDGFIPGTEWEDYKTTLTSAGDGFHLCFGFTSAAAGDAFLVDFGDSVYFAPEEAYDIAVEAVSGSKIVLGNTAEFKASLLNQIGLTGALAQNFTWSVTDASGNAVDGLTITSAEDTVTATVATDGAAAGTYYVKAVSTAENWQKTMAIEVVEGIANITDFVPGEKPANLITSPKNTKLWYGHPTYLNSTTYQTKEGWTSDGYAGYGYKTTGTVTAGNGYQYAAGARLTNSTSYTLFNENTYSAGENYVIEFAARSLTPEQPAFGVRVGIWNGKYSGLSTDLSQLMGYEGGIAPVAADGSWTTIKGTFPALTDDDVADGRFPAIVVGMAVGTVADTIVEFNSHYDGVAEPYFAKEVPHEFNVEGDDSTTAGGVLTLEAELLNQIGLAGALSQEFKWVAVTEDRTSYADGITVTPHADDSSVATVKVAKSVPAGNYIIVAQSEAEGISRQYPITVTSDTHYDVTELTLTKTADSASVTSASVICDKDVDLMIAAYRGGELIDIKLAVLTPVYSVATFDDTLTLTGLQTGDKVRVFVWDDGLVPYVMKEEFQTPVIIE